MEPGARNGSEPSDGRRVAEAVPGDRPAASYQTQRASSRARTTVATKGLEPASLLCMVWLDRFVVVCRHTAARRYGLESSRHLL